MKTEVLGTELEEIHEFIRKGATLSEFWSFLLNSSRHQKFWLQQNPQSALSFEVWRFLLEEERKSYILAWEKEHPDVNPYHIKWSEIFFSSKSRNFRRDILTYLNQNSSHSNNELVEVMMRSLIDHECMDIAASFLKKIDPEMKEAVPLLISLLKEKNETLKMMVAFALRQIGPLAKEAIPVLLEERSDPNEGVRREVYNTLKVLMRETPELFLPLENPDSGKAS
jgi:hypothetical protein